MRILGYLKKEIQVLRKWKGIESIVYNNRLLVYVKDLFLDALKEGNQFDSVLYYLQESIPTIKKHMNSSIYTMSSKERKSYWERNYKYVFTQIVPITCSILGNEEANSMAYDASLYYKGMLLSAEIEIGNVIESSNDNVLRKIHKEYIMNLSLLEKQDIVTSSSTTVDSLKAKIQQEEYLLSQAVTRYNKRYKGTDVSWKDIRDKLNEQEAAFEIVSYPYWDGVTRYDAYVINHSSISPIQIHLFDEKTLKRHIGPDSIDYIRLSELIWGNRELLTAIGNAQKVFFSASGLLNTIGIEYLPFSNTHYLFNYIDLYRLSSTREIVNRGPRKELRNVCLYGGLDYNSIYHSLNYKNKESINERLSRSITNKIIERGGFEPLTGSKEEVLTIRKEIENNAINCMVYTETTGTEESLKKLSGSNIDILHISTHGMYVSNEKKHLSKYKDFRFMLSNNDQEDIDEKDQALSRSFLVMSGGNILIHRDSVPTEKDDGILTALEISHLNFSDLDLAVLSACQTALGEIDSEGIYGLQRGFKMAGARTILMSLDKVDDEATKILMVEFYRNLMAGVSKHQALKDAQHYLRQVENGRYNDPKFWASFIMLDGLN